MKILRAVVASCLVLVSCSTLFAEETKAVRKIAVSGKAENTVEAQRAEVGLSLKIVKKDMSQSHAALTSELSRLAKELNAIGIPDKDIKRSLVLQGAEYNWEKESRVLKGYYAECYVDVTVNDITKMAALYRTLAGHKEITIGSTDFKRNDEFELRKAEYEKALVAAKKKAEFMVQTLGAKVGRVHSIVEEGGDSWLESKPYQANFRDKGEMSGTPSSYGTIRISARVTVEFELE